MQGISFLGTIIFLLAFVFILFTVILFFSPKLRGKMLSKQIKAAKYMVDESKDDIESISTDMATATQKGKEITTSAIARGIKKGLTEDDELHCKHCGSVIDSDSKYCKKCGKEQ